MNFVARYLQRSASSVLCVGLDPTPEHVPPGFGSGLRAMEAYLRAVIDIAAAKRVPVVKPQFAYYAALGTSGTTMLRRLIKYAHSLDLLVILDAKRSDIGDTMKLYGDEVFGWYEADAATFVPYMGSTFSPSWLPWLAKGRCAISMIRTSNPEAGRLQDEELKAGLLVHERVALLVKEWDKAVYDQTNGEGSVGGVVGAAFGQASRCRQLAGDEVFFLIPGYGAQGGGAESAVKGLINSRGESVGTVNSSRGITRDSWYNKATGQPREGDPIELVGKAIDAANAELNEAVQTFG